MDENMEVICKTDEDYLEFTPNGVVSMTDIL